jgi:hypothetical protein
MTGQPDQQLLTATEKSMEGLVEKENLDFVAATMMFFVSINICLGSLKFVFYI